MNQVLLMTVQWTLFIFQAIIDSANESETEDMVARNSEKLEAGINGRIVQQEVFVNINLNLQFAYIMKHDKR